MKPKNTLEKIQAGSRNIRFEDMQRLVEAFGFEHSRTRGSHHIYIHPDLDELINLQNVKGEAKNFRFGSS